MEPNDQSNQSTPTTLQRSVEDLFDAVRELPPEAREAAIDSGTANPWVRAEVRSLLHFDDLDAKTIGSLHSADALRGARFDAEACIGLAIDGFTLRRVIGVGGMGTVFEADQEMPARKIAVKVLHGALARPSTLARFRKESAFLARLDHPNIARVIAAGTLHVPGDGGARPYFAMELVEGGRAITRWARETHASRADIVRVVADACDAVGAGHRSGIVHLDLKPGNLIVSRTGALRVIDYGIATSISRNRGEADEKADGETGGEAADKPTEKTAGAPEGEREVGRPLVGTPQYMSPEQFDGASGRVDSRADVYALGLILYELLTGRLPYQTRGAGIDAISATVRATEPTAPRRIDATIEQDLESVVLKAIAKRSDARYGTAGELADELRRWLADEVVLAAETGPLGLMMRYFRKNKMVGLLVAAVILSVAVGALVSFSFALQSREAADRARIQAARANQKSASSSLELNNPADAVLRLEEIPAELRGWEARHVSARMANFEIYSSCGSEVLCVAPIAATNELLVGITGGFLEIVDLDHVRPTEVIDLRPMYGSTAGGSVAGTSASPDGATILLHTTEGRVFAIDRASSSLTPLGTGASISAGFVGNGPEGQARTVCCIYAYGGAETIALSTGKPLHRFSFDDPIADASRSADGATIIVGQLDGVLRCIEIDAATSDLRERWRTQPRALGARAVAIAPDASVIVVAWKDGSITRIDPANGATLAERELWGGSAFELVISPDARTIAASSWSRTVRVIDMDSLAVRDCFSGTHAHVWGIAFSPDGTRIFGRIVLPELAKPGAPKSNADCAGAWIVAGNKAIRSIDTQHRPVVATFGPVPSLFTSATDDGTIYEFDAAQGTTRALGVVAGLNTSSVIYSITRSERFIAVGLTDGAVVLLEPREQDDGLGNERKGGANATASLVERWRVRPGVSGSVTLAFDPKGAMIACGFSGNSAAMLSVADGGVLWTAELPTGDAVPGRMSVVKPVFEGEQDRVAFATVLSNSPFRLFRAHDGKVLNPNGNSKMAESDVGIWRAEDERFYFLGITGCIFTDEGHIASTKNIAQDGGVLCTDRAQTRLFTATREAVTRVIAFDPLEEIMRLDSPAGRPVAIGFDDALDQLTVLTSSGVARSWLGRTIAPPTIVARPTLKASVFDAPPYDEPAPRRDQK